MLKKTKIAKAQHMNQTKTRIFFSYECKNNTVTARALYVKEKDKRQGCTDGCMDGEMTCWTAIDVEGENLNQFN